MACCPQETSAERKGMRLVRLRAPGGLENLKLVEGDHPKPRPGELLVRIRASSLNFHDDMVVLGKIPCAESCQKTTAHQKDQARSNRSRFITLFQAATKSLTNFFSASELA